MKRMISVMTALAMLGTMIMMSGCSDFSFNPIGKWYLVSDELYNGDKLLESTYFQEEHSFDQMAFVFEKSGTGYFQIDDLDVENRKYFTYEYDDDTVTVTYKADDSEAKSEDSTMEPVVLRMSEDKETMINQFERYAYDDDDLSTIVELKETISYKRNIKK